MISTTILRAQIPVPLQSGIAFANNSPAEYTPYISVPTGPGGVQISLSNIQSIEEPSGIVGADPDDLFLWVNPLGMPYGCSGWQYQAGVSSVPEFSITLYNPPAGNYYIGMSSGSLVAYCEHPPGEGFTVSPTAYNVTATLLPPTWNFSTNNGKATLTEYLGSGASVTIPDEINGFPVTSIGNEAFDGCVSLASVTIPDSITNVGIQAFHDCTNLTNVTFGNGVTTIGANAFLDCYRLTSVTIPDSVTSIGGGAFEVCVGLTNVTLGNGVTNIGDYAFYDCSSLTSIAIPNGVTGIGNWEFAYCFNLTNVTIPINATSIGDNAFYECSLTSVTIPNSVTQIGGAAFEFCKLTSVTIPNSVTGSIGDDTFYGCYALASVTIPSSITGIGNAAFDDCSSLTSVIIPNSVTNIGDDAFGECEALASVVIPNSVTSIGDDAFVECGSLNNLTIGDGVTSIGDDAFFSCNDLTSVTIPTSVTGIAEGAFEACISLTAVTIPNSVTNIGDYAFYECSSLTSVIIPNCVTSIGEYAFGDCSSLTNVFFAGNAPSVDGEVGSMDTTVFAYDRSGEVYYLPGTTGWGTTFGGWPTAFWYQSSPSILGSGYGLRATPNGFGFTIAWATNLTVVIQACTNLANPIWMPVATNPLVGGTNYFSDPQWTNFSGRFYRISAP